MESRSKPHYAGGRNIALKTPPHLWERTVAFYRDVLGLKVIEHAPTEPPSVGFQFGANRLWVDRIETVSQAELWLEVTTDDVTLAAQHLAAAEVVRCDQIEPLPEGFQGFWIQSPASIVHLVAKAPVADAGEKEA